MCVFKDKGLSRYSVIKILVGLEEHLRIEGVSWEFSGVPFPGDLLWGGACTYWGPLLQVSIPLSLTIP